MIRLYGISNCSTVKKARNWLTQNNIDYGFTDYKKTAANQEKLQNWCNKFGWQKILNTNGLTYKKLDTQAKANINNQKDAINYMLNATSSIKRPIIETDCETILGFDIAVYEKTFL